MLADRLPLCVSDAISSANSRASLSFYSRLRIQKGLLVQPPHQRLPLFNCSDDTSFEMYCSMFETKPSLIGWLTARTGRPAQTVVHREQYVKQHHTRCSLCGSRSFPQQQLLTSIRGIVGNGVHCRSDKYSEHSGTWHQNIKTLGLATDKHAVILVTRLQLWSEPLRRSKSLISTVGRRSASTEDQTRLRGNGKMLGPRLFCVRQTPAGENLTVYHGQ